MSCNCENKFPKTPHCGCHSCNECIPIPVDNESIFFNPSDFTSFDLTNPSWSELTVNGCVDVPYVKPNMEAIVGVDSKIEIVRTKVVVAPGPTGATPPWYKNEENKTTTGSKLVIEGLICSTISYVAAHADQKVHTFHGKIPFSAYIVLPHGTTVDTTYNVTGYIEDLMVKSACERKACLCATFILQAVEIAAPTCTNGTSDPSGITCGNACLLPQNRPCDCEHPIIQGISSDAQIEAILDPTETLWTQMFIPEILNIPSCKPNLQKLLTVTVKLEILCQKVVATPIDNTTIANNTNPENLITTGRKLLIEGVLKQRITYVSCTEEESVHSAHFDVPISAFIILPASAKLTDKFQLSSVIEDIFACGLNERQIFKNTTLFIKATEM